MNVSDHERNLQESLEVLDESIAAGLQKRQRTIGFHVSVAAVDLLELYLHKKGVLPTSEIIKHGIFGSLKKAEKNIPFDFDRKKEVLQLIVSIEEKRNSFCYGKQREKEQIQAILDAFNQLKKIFTELNKNEK